jgi:thiol-disulfide isomerase/thioredoxin
MRSVLLRTLLLVSLTVALGCDSVSSLKPAGGSGSLAPVETVSRSAPEVKLELKSFDDLQKLIASKQGKLVVVDAWSTYCEPCMKEFPNLVALHKQHGDQVACISLCANYSGLGKPEDEKEEPRKFLQSQGATFDNILSTDPDTKLYKSLDIVSVPAILVYDRAGKLLKKFDGEPTYKDVEAFLAPLLTK